jgi:hypothetical protein
LHHGFVAILAELLTAIGTIAVAILAIWGGYFKARFAGPQLELSLTNSQGHLIPFGNGNKAYYYHLNVTNKRTWAPAEAVQVLVTGIAKRGPDDRFREEPLVFPHQLVWTPAELIIPYRLIVDTAKCDLGSLNRDNDRFMLATATKSNTFRGYVDFNEAIRVQVRVSAQNVRPVRPLVLEIAWNGKWSDNPNEMEHNLIVKSVEELTS